jgi:hypothetical protein
VGGLYFSPFVSGESSIYDGKELQQGGLNPITVAWERFQSDLEKIFNVDFDNYDISKPEGSLIEIEKVKVAGVEIGSIGKVNTGIIWEYVKIIPEATIKILFGKIIEFFNVIISLFNIGLISFVEIINTIQATTYEMMGIEWEYSTGALSEGDRIYYRSVTIYSPDGDTATIGQFIHYIYGLVIGIIILLVALKILDNIIGIWGWDIPFI